MILPLLKQSFTPSMAVTVALAVTSLLATSTYAADFQIDSASWRVGDNRLVIRGEGDRRLDVIVTNADSGAFVGQDDVNRRGGAFG